MPSSSWQYYIIFRVSAATRPHNGLHNGWRTGRNIYMHIIRQNNCTCIHYSFSKVLTKLNLINILTESPHCADSVYKLWCPSICLLVCLSASCPPPVTPYWRGMETSSQRGFFLKILNKVLTKKKGFLKILQQLQPQKNCHQHYFLDKLFYYNLF